MPYTAITTKKLEQAGKFYETRELAEQDAARKNAKAEELGIETRYMASEDIPVKSNEPVAKAL